MSQPGLLRKLPGAASTPAAPQAFCSSSGQKTNSAVLKATAAEAANTSVTDNEVIQLPSALTLQAAELKQINYALQREHTLVEIPLRFVFFYSKHSVFIQNTV